MKKIMFAALYVCAPWLAILLIGEAQLNGKISMNAARLLFLIMLLLTIAGLIFRKRIFDFEINQRQMKIFILLMIIFFISMSAVIKLLHPEVRLIFFY